MGRRTGEQAAEAGHGAVHARHEVEEEVEERAMREHHAAHHKRHDGNLRAQAQRAALALVDAPQQIVRELKHLAGKAQRASVASSRACVRTSFRLATTVNV